MDHEVRNCFVTAKIRNVAVPVCACVCVACTLLMIMIKYTLTERELKGLFFLGHKAEKVQVTLKMAFFLSETVQPPSSATLDNFRP